MKTKAAARHRSIRKKYRRRQLHLAYAVDAFLDLARERLEEGGNIRDRAHMQKLVEIFSSVRQLLPNVTDGDLDAKVFLALNKRFDID